MKLTKEFKEFLAIMGTMLTAVLVIVKVMYWVTIIASRGIEEVFKN